MAWPQPWPRPQSASAMAYIILFYIVNKMKVDVLQSLNFGVASHQIA